MNQPSTLGGWLLARARDHGLTNSELADILGLPIHRIRQITTTDLDDLPGRALAALAERLDLDWPQWLTHRNHQWLQHQAQPPSEPDTTADADRVHAVLALVIGRKLRLDQIAHILGWPVQRVQQAAATLAPLLRAHRGLRLIVHHNQILELTVAPRTIDAAARERLLQLTYHQQGPAPGIALVAYRATNGDHRQVTDLLRQAPDLLTNAAAAGFITYTLGEDGQPAAIELAPDVAYSLGMVNQLNDDN
jgi:hypothetical protein